MKFNSILVIDDSFYDRFIAREMIEDYLAVHTITCLESGAEGLEYLTQRQGKQEDLPEIILLDIRMPLMDGFGFLDNFNTLASSVKTYCKIFILSSSIDPTDMARAKKHPLVVDFLTKPLTKEKIEAVSVILNSRNNEQL